jgi:UDP-N-acetylglucosamine 2-epimerase
VYGDVNSTLGAALVAAKLGIPLAHVEAGLRSFDDSMPEEINRRLTDQLCVLLFATSPEAIGHLANEGVAVNSVHLVGNPMIDTLVANLDRFDTGAARSARGLPALRPRRDRGRHRLGRGPGGDHAAPGALPDPPAEHRAPGHHHQRQQPAGHPR